VPEKLPCFVYFKLNQETREVEQRQLDHKQVLECCGYREGGFKVDAGKLEQKLKGLLVPVAQ